jgi:hypothetical protein
VIKSIQSAGFGTDVALGGGSTQSIFHHIHKLESKVNVRSFLKTFLLGSAFSTIWATTSRAEECAVFFEHPHQSGAAWELEAETELANISNAMIERRKWCGSLRGFCKGKDRSWNDSVSSIRVNPGCHLMTWADQDFTGETRLFYASGRETAYETLFNDDKITSFRCTCSMPEGSSTRNIMYRFQQGEDFSEVANP